MQRWGEKGQGKTGIEPDKGAKNNGKDFYRYVNQKRKVKECVPHLINRAESLIAMDEEKPEVLIKLLPQSLLSTSLPTPLKWRDSRMGSGGAKCLSSASEDQVHDLLKSQCT